MARAEFSTAVTNSIELKWKPLFSILDLSILKSFFKRLVNSIQKKKSFFSRQVSRNILTSAVL